MEIDIENILGIPSRLIVSYTVPALINDCDFFNELEKLGSGNLADLAKFFNYDQRVFENVVNYLTKEKFLEKDIEQNEQVWRLSESSRQFLLKSSSYDFSGYATILDTCVPRKVGDAIISALKTGQPAKWTNGETWPEAMKSGDITEHFSKGMMARGSFLKDGLSHAIKDVLNNTKKLLDVGGSFGDYCGKFTTDYINLETCVFDFPSVIEKAKENIAKKNYKRVSVLSGDMFQDDFPNDFDAILYSNATHDWDKEQNQFLFNKTYDSLPKGGKIIIHDCHLNNDKLSPGFAVDHSLYLSVFTNGTYYSYAEISDLLVEAGFSNIEVIKTVAGFSAVVGYKTQ